MALGGLSVATSADLSHAMGAMEEKFDAQRRWCETQITDFIMKLRNSTEKLDMLEREQSTALETLNSDMKVLKASTVQNASFRQHISQMEKRFHDERDQVDGKLDGLKTTLEKDMIANIGNLRLKAETLNSNCIALTEKCKVIEDTFLPAIRGEMEEQKSKRLTETQRLESDVEKMKEICEQKISHTAAALRFYVTATTTKLREELCPMTVAKELEVDLKQKESDLKKLIKSAEDLAISTKEECGKLKEHQDSTLERFSIEANQHTKNMKVLEISMTNLQSSVATDMNDTKEEVRNDVSKMKIEVSDCRATSARSCAMNENRIEAISSEISPLKSFREQVMDRMHIEKFVNVVREWQTTTIPQVTSQAKDFETRSQKMLVNQVKDHEVLVELQKSVAEVRRHFKLFHHIASGLEERSEKGLLDPMMTDMPPDTRLPPIGSYAAS